MLEFGIIEQEKITQLWLSWHAFSQNILFFRLQVVIIGIAQYFSPFGRKETSVLA